MKTIFELECLLDKSRIDTFEKIKIIGQAPNHKPYVVINLEHDDLFIKDKDLERFATNILKALKSKRLNP